MRFNRKLLLSLTFAATLAVGAVATVAAQTSSPDDSSPVTAERYRHRHGPLGLTAEFLGIEPAELVQALRDGETPAAVAEGLGVDSDALADYLVDEITEKIEEAEEAGRIDADRAAQLIANLPEHVSTWVQEGPRHDSDGDDRPHGHARAHLLRLIADVIGVEPEVIVAGVEDGLSIAEIAEQNGSSGEAVVDAVAVRLREHLDRAVENGRLTADEADERFERMLDRISERVFGAPAATSV